MTTIEFRILIAITCVLLVSICLWVLRSLRQLKLFKKLGIPGPEPQFFWGNIKQMRQNQTEVLMRWKKKYGRTFGVYLGNDPCLCITDPGMVYECFMKEAAIFQDRPKCFLDAEPFRSSLFQTTGTQWKFVRRVLKHVAHSGHIIQLYTQANQTITRLVECLTNAIKEKECVDVTDFAMQFGLDFVANILLSWKVNTEKNINNEALRSLVDLSKEMNSAAIDLAFTPPLLRCILSWLYPFTKHARMFNFLMRRVQNTVESRRSGQNTQNADLLQVLIDVQPYGCNKILQGSVNREKHFSDQQIFSNVVIFMFAGFEAMSSALSFSIYLLAKHASEQEAILREWNERFPDKSVREVTFEEVRQLKRLDMVVKECLRLYPPVPVVVVRRCLQDTVVSGQFIPAGINVAGCPWLIHRDSDIWPNPEVFCPERFAEGATKQKRGAYFPFGLGPRVCPFKELALITLKCALLRLLISCTLKLTGDSAGEVQACARSMTLVPERGIHIKLDRRMV